MWNLKYDTNELIYKTEIDLQTQRRDVWLPKEKMVDNQELGVNRYMLYKIDKQQGSTVWHREVSAISCSNL